MFHGHQKLESVEKAKNGENKYFLNLALMFKKPFLTLKHWEESWGGGAQEQLHCCSVGKGSLVGCQPSSS